MEETFIARRSVPSVPPTRVACEGGGLPVGPTLGFDAVIEPAIDTESVPLLRVQFLDVSQGLVLCVTPNVLGKFVTPTFHVPDCTAFVFPWIYQGEEPPLLVP